jgi:hypothetical protein
MVAERVVASLPSWASGDQKRRRSPVALVGGAVGRPQPVLLMHRTKDDVESHERQQDGAVRRHTGQEQEEPQGSEVARVAAEAERTRSDHLAVGAERRPLRLRGGTNVPAPEEVPQRR